MLSQQQIEQSLLAPLQELENERKDIVQQTQTNIIQGIAASIAVLLGGIGLIAILYLIKGPYIIATFVVNGIVILFIYIIIESFRNKSKALKKQFEDKVKQDVYQGLFKAWRKDCHYQPRSYIPSAVFKQSKLYEDYYDNYKGDDLCTGKLEDGRAFQFSELVARRQIHSSKGQGNDNFETVFKGLFFVVKGSHVLQNMQVPTFVQPQKQDDYQKKQKKKQLPKSNKKYTTNILDADFSATLTSNKKEDTPLFDQLYNIKSTQQWTVRQKLSPEFYRNLNYMRVNLRQQIRLSFEGDTIYMAVPHQFDFWVVNVKESLISPQRLRYLAWNFNLAFDLLEQLIEGTKVE